MLKIQHKIKESAVKNALARRVKIALDEKLFPGCVIGVVNRRGLRLVAPFGKYRYKIFSKSIREDSVFDVASITKAIPLAMVTLVLAEQTKLSLDDPIVSYIPDFDTSPEKRKVTIRHLITNTLDLNVPALSSMKDAAPHFMVKRVCEAPLATPPGNVYKYTNASSLLLSLCIMKAVPQSLGVLAKSLLFDHLGMKSSTFDVRMNRLETSGRIVPTEIDPWRKRELRGEVQDESTYILQRLYGKNCIGNAGLFSTVPDLLTFVEMLLNGGTFHGHTYFSENMVTAMHTNHFPKADGSGGLGFALYPQDYMGTRGNKYMFGKTGFAGTMIVLDRAKERGLVILSNYHYPHRKKNLEPNRVFRADICNIVFA